jgi:hypothetical protein
MATRRQTGTRRERGDRGRYDLTNLEQVCCCGRKAGEHLAKRPHSLEETECAGFRAETQTDRIRRMSARANGARSLYPND